MYSFTDLFAIFLLLGLLYLLGFRVVRRVDKTEIPLESRSPVEDSGRLQHRRQVLLNALDEPPFTDILSPQQRERLRYSILHPGDMDIERPSAQDLDTSSPTSPAPKPASQIAQPVQANALPFRYRSEPSAFAASTTSASSPPPAVTVPPRKVSPPPPPRKPILETIRSSWDPAVMMLYLGALLVVIAGLIFATYNWGTLGGWQKLGMLAAATCAFLAAGLAIRKFDRVKPAATTFIIIGGLLVPANFLAAYTVFDDVQPAMPLFFGAVTTTVIHALLSFQPGARIFRYSAVAAALLAISTVPAALGLAAGWGGVVGLVVISMLPDYLFGLKRFQSAWVVISRSAAGPLAGFSLWQGWNTDGWMIAATCVGVSMVARRFSMRYPALRAYFLVVADLALIAASVQIAFNFDGDRWMVSAGLLALTMVLWQESRRFCDYDSWFEMAAAFATALLIGDVVRVLGTEPWAVASGALTLAMLMVLHARRHASLAFITECVTAAALPISLAAAVYAIYPSLWSLVIGLGSLAVTGVWLGLRQHYAENWPGMVATCAAIATIVTIAPAVGPDVGWGCVAALIVVALAPYPFGRLDLFATPWVRFANALSVPVALVGLWRGAEINDWLIPITLVVLSMWLNRLALEEVFESSSLLIYADVMAILGIVNTAWILREDTWLLASALLALTLVLMKRTRTWPAYAAALEFAACITISGFVGEVIREFADSDWGLAAAAITLTIAMLTHARRYSGYERISEGVAVLSLSFAVGMGIFAWNESAWCMPVGVGVLTLALIVYGFRHQTFGNLSFAIASGTGIFAVLRAGYLLDYTSDPTELATMLVALGLVLNTIANVLLPQMTFVSSALKNLLRMEAVVVFFFAMAAGDFDQAPVFVVVTLAIFWNLWMTQRVFWSLPMASVLIGAWGSIVVPDGVSVDERMWWHLGLVVLLTALAWQLDRRTQRDKLRAGVYVWLLVSLLSTRFLFTIFILKSEIESGIEHAIVLLIAAALHWIGYRSTNAKVFLAPIGVLAIAANVVFIFGDISAGEHTVLAAILLAMAGALYWQTSGVRLWLAYTAFALGLVQIQLATDLSYARDLQLGVVFAWILVSLGIVRWRSVDSTWQVQPIFLQAMMLHGLAPLLPTLDLASKQITRPDVVLILVSLAGVVSAFGALHRSRQLVLLGSALGMSALMLQINIGAPGNLHAYTVPLSVYLLAVGLLLRREPRIANILLAAGSGMLVVPAMIEALSTGEMMWLWISLAEALALFLLGAMFRLRIPAATGVIAVSVIALRMLVFVINALASWMSILAIGVGLLLIGTLWLVFRDAIQAQAQALLARWRSFA